MTATLVGRLACVALGALLTALPATAHAQAVGKIRGVVFDSLWNRPLAGATVLVSGSSRIGVTDERGIFTLDSVPVGRRSLSLSAPSLDSLGLFSLSRDVNVIAGQEVAVPMGTPSFATMWRSLCPRTIAVRGDSGIVYGSIINAANDVRLQGARVIVQWWSYESNGRQVVMDRPVSVARSDSTGNYYACGLPTDVALSIEVGAGEMSAGNAELQLGTSRISRRDFFVSNEMRVPVQDTVPRSTSRMGAPVVPPRVRARGTATLRGMVRDAKGMPVVNALITLPSADTSGRSDATGAFAIGGLPAGTQLVRVLKLGNGPLVMQVDLRPGRSTEVLLDLPPATVLARMNVVADRKVSAEQTAFEERKKTGFGYYVSEKDLVGRSDMASALQGLPAVQVQRRGVLANVLINRGASTCAPDLYLDGRRSSIDELTFFRPEDLYGIEVYSRAQTVPAQFITSNNCGAIIVWTKRGRT